MGVNSRACWWWRRGGWWDGSSLLSTHEKRLSVEELARRAYPSSFFPSRLLPDKAKWHWKGRERRVGEGATPFQWPCNGPGPGVGMGMDVVRGDWGTSPGRGSDRSAPRALAHGRGALEGWRGGEGCGGGWRDGQPQLQPQLQRLAVEDGLAGRQLRTRATAVAGRPARQRATQLPWLRTKYLPTRTLHGT